MPEDPKRTRLRRALIEVGAVFLAALCVTLATRHFLLETYSLPTPSMAPALQSGDRILVNKLVPQSGPLHRGDVVVFRDSGDWLQNDDHYLVKRVIGLPGDVVTCCQDNRVTVNGQEIDEVYLLDPADNTDFSGVVPVGEIWVMNDDRTQEADSRTRGPVPLSDVVGVTIARIWPLDRLTGSLNDEAPFTEVKGERWISTTRRAS